MTKMWWICLKAKTLSLHTQCSFCERWHRVNRFFFQETICFQIPACHLFIFIVCWWGDHEALVTRDGEWNPNILFILLYIALILHKCLQCLNCKGRKATFWHVQNLPGTIYKHKKSTNRQTHIQVERYTFTLAFPHPDDSLCVHFFLQWTTPNTIQ